MDKLSLNLNRIMLHKQELKGSHYLQLTCKLKPGMTLALT